MKKRRLKKKNKEVISFEKLKTFRKIFSAFFSIVIVFDVFTHIVVRSQTVSASLKDTTEKLAISKVIEEQMDHFVRARGVIKESEKTMLAIEDFIATIEAGGFLSNEQKKDLAIELKSVEENIFVLQNVFDEYYNDATVQFHPRANSNISNYIYETSYLKLAMERFSRRVESYVLFSSLNASGKTIILEDFYDIIWQLENLKELEKNLNVFETLK